MFEVLSPAGEAVVQGTRSIAPRIPDLNGKTVCEVWNDGFKGEVSFPIIREMLKKRYPGVKIVPYSELTLQRVQGSTEQLSQRLEAIIKELKEKGCDAVIAGNGG